MIALLPVMMSLTPTAFNQLHFRKHAEFMQSDTDIFVSKQERNMKSRQTVRHTHTHTQRYTRARHIGSTECNHLERKLSPRQVHALGQFQNQIDGGEGGERRGVGVGGGIRNSVSAFNWNSVRNLTKKLIKSLNIQSYWLRFGSIV